MLFPNMAVTKKSSQEISAYCVCSRKKMVTWLKSSFNSASLPLLMKIWSKLWVEFLKNEPIGFSPDFLDVAPWRNTGKEYFCGQTRVSLESKNTVCGFKRFLVSWASSKGLTTPPKPKLVRTARWGLCLFVWIDALHPSQQLWDIACIVWDYLHSGIVKGVTCTAFAVPIIKSVRFAWFKGFIDFRLCQS